MRVAGRQKGSKVKPYTHILVQPSAPKTRYVFAYYSSETKAKAAHKKYEPLIGNPLRVVKQSGKSANTDMHEATKRIPRKKGQPAGSDKHSDLYTDENPKGTIHGLKFATVDDAKASVSKIKNSGKKHAHQIQAAIAMEQRARVMGKAGPAAVYRAFINKMKKKTKAMQKESLEEKGLWHNIHMKRKRGERMRKKGEKGAPTADALRSAQAKSEDLGTGGTTTASIPNPATTAMGPRLKTTTMHDKRRKKDKFPVLLKRFRKYIEDNYG
tara:strand:+ start:1514 stop:2320 length:807 start_codon:yes stop_codon:yes gene_type:complete